MKTLKKAKLNSKASKETSKESIYDISINDINDNLIDINTFRGKKMLFVNVASKCGFTKQYDELQELYNKHQETLIIIGVPCNQFGSQEPGNASQIKEFCSLNYGVEFPITEKIHVKGSKQHPLYTWLTSKKHNGKKNSSVKWNFQKYLVDENGVFIDYFYSFIKPTSSKISKHL